MFTVRSFYHVLVPHESAYFSWKSIWWHKVALRVALFAWTAALGKILILEILRKLIVIVVDWYCMCKKSG
jgi:hypothetical protein